MELIILVGLALFILFAATVDRQEPEIETIVIARPEPQSRPRPFARMIVALMIALIALIVLERLAGLLGL